MKNRIVQTCRSVASLLLGCMAAAGMAYGAGAKNEVQIIVKPRPEMPDAALHALITAQGGRQNGEIPQLGARIIRLPAQAAQRGCRS
jgi:hypothetical protein